MKLTICNAGMVRWPCFGAHKESNNAIARRLFLFLLDLVYSRNMSAQPVFHGDEDRMRFVAILFDPISMKCHSDQWASNLIISFGGLGGFSSLARRATKYRSQEDLVAALKILCDLNLIANAAAAFGDPAGVHPVHRSRPVI